MKKTKELFDQKQIDKIEDIITMYNIKQQIRKDEEFDKKFDIFFNRLGWFLTGLIPTTVIFLTLIS